MLLSQSFYCWIFHVYPFLVPFHDIVESRATFNMSEESSDVAVAVPSDAVTPAESSVESIVSPVSTTESASSSVNPESSPSPSPDPSPKADAEPAKQRITTVIDMGGGAVKCVNCEKRSYPAETIFFEKLPYHFDCFRCKKCNEKMPNTVNSAKFEHDIYCRRCFNNLGLLHQQTQSKWGAKIDGSAPASTASKMGTLRLGGGGTSCTGCSKTCYPAEAISFESKLYHADCLRCSECTAKCTVNNANKFDEKLYCSKCWDKGGYAMKQRDSRGSHRPTPSASGQFGTMRFGGGGNPCSSCNKTCYAAEGVSFEGKLYHAECMRCSDCTVKCILTNVNKYDEKLYCGKCWDKGGYAMKQRDERNASRTATTTTASTGVTSRFGGGGTPCASCNKTCYAAEGVMFETKLYHGDCLRCSECTVRCTLINVNKFDEKLFCGKCWEKGQYANKQRDVKWEQKDSLPSPTASGSSDAPKPRFGGGGTKCTTCNKTVYPAEQVLYETMPYHPTCFNCTHCGSRLVATHAQHKAKKPYCSKCFQELGLWRADA